jgi:transposase
MRARKIRLHPQTRQRLKKLKKIAEQDGEYRVAKRLHAVLLNHDDHSSGSIANLLPASRSKVSEWLKNYEAYGYESLLEGHRSGRPSNLTREEKQNLCDIMDSGPRAYGYLSGVWDSLMITEVIHSEFGVQFHPGHVRKLLYRLGFSVQRPKNILANADPQKQNKWRRYTYPNIKKKLSGKKPL